MLSGLCGLHLLITEWRHSCSKAGWLIPSFALPRSPCYSARVTRLCRLLQSRSEGYQNTAAAELLQGGVLSSCVYPCFPFLSSQAPHTRRLLEVWSKCDRKPWRRSCCRVGAAKLRVSSFQFFSVEAVRMRRLLEVCTGGDQETVAAQLLQGGALPRFAELLLRTRAESSPLERLAGPRLALEALHLLSRRSQE